ncbi:ECF transporter S component [Streptococcus sp. DD12]|uniref:ECF transporter S component n=1 Tax=Streptococcus sp. DD12 TaxID=1777880 RepID=UPI0007957580|nr:ECF transporter S component [Streptococcus sp. DD12]KXT75329.1 Substrate-specific component PdxU2 of putative pyridoxin-related ECF transporter [Streptococcus sp. DD12]
MQTKRLTLGSFFMALTIILSSSWLSFPVAGGHFYFNGILIFLVALIFQPWEAVIIAGFGSFLGDFFFYPLPMFVTLVVHSVQVLVIALLLKRYQQPAPKIPTIMALLMGSVIVVVGYFFGRGYVYSTLAYAWMKLPFDILAAILGASVAYVIYYHTDFLNSWKALLKG